MYEVRLLPYTNKNKTQEQYIPPMEVLKILVRGDRSIPTILHQQYRDTSEI